MAKTFKGFTNQQTHQLLKEMGFTGPAQKDEMDAFLASSPSAASKIGRYAEIAKQRVEGGPLSGMGFAQGDLVEKVKDPNEYTTVSRITPNVSTDVDIGTIEDEGDFVFDRASDAYAGDRGVPDFSRSSADDGVTPPEGSQVIVEGTPTPETTQPSIDLDAAQQSYSDAMGQLTEAQKALSGAEQPVENVDNFDAAKYYLNADQSTKANSKITIISKRI